MQNKIEVGEYVKTTEGDIGKVSSIEKSPLRYSINNFNLIVMYEDIVKHSKDIIDLIEVGDIVELVDVLSEEVVYIWDEEMLEAVKQDIEEGQTLKSIVTKEQFESMKYKVQEAKDE